MKHPKASRLPRRIPCATSQEARLVADQYNWAVRSYAIDTVWVLVFETEEARRIWLNDCGTDSTVAHFHDDEATV